MKTTPFSTFTRRMTTVTATMAWGLALAMVADSQAAVISNANVSGYFTNAAIWVGGVVPGAGDTTRFQQDGYTVTIDGGNRTVQQLWSTRTGPAFYVLNMDPGATLLTTLKLGGTVIVSNGTLQVDGGVDLGGGNVGLIGGFPAGSLILSGGNFSQTNSTLFRFEAGGDPGVGRGQPRARGGREHVHLRGCE
jgi:hypothetical protein